MMIPPTTPLPVEPKSIITNCEFEFQCPKNWESLDKTSNSAVRFCNSCSRKVYFCKTQEQLDANSEKGRCVAIEQPRQKIKLPPLLGVRRIG
jgi:hypothetical protein